MNHLLRRSQGPGMTIFSFFCLATNSAWAQDAHGTRPGMANMASAQKLIAKQLPPVVNKAVLAQTTPDNATVLVSLSRQRAYLYAGTQLAIDTPVSSGKKAGFTPTGDFTI